MANAQSPKPETVRANEQDDVPTPAPHKPMTAGQQVALTVKLLGGGALLGALVWFIDSAL